MVARINTGKNIAKALNYNEQKVKQGKAEILLASGFIKDAGKLTFYDKISQFQRHISLNERTATNTLHVSLNFDPSEKLSNEKLICIAETYMDKIGFGSQSYLVYRHDDAGHPHIHIVSTNIKNDGSRLSMHNMGRNQSEKARKAIESAFGLVKAESKKSPDNIKITPVIAEKVNYGRSETKRAIANVLMVVLNQYKYTSLPELNAVLGLYNVVADRGTETSRMYQQNGLVYRVLDSAGNKIGTPIKASSFYMSPTLAFLESKFRQNESLRLPGKSGLQTSISWMLHKQPKDMEAFVKNLEKDNINVILRYSKTGTIYGVTYVDHKTKCVFNGSDLGKSYSAKAILEKLQEKHAITSRPEVSEKRLRPVMDRQDKKKPSAKQELTASPAENKHAIQPQPDYIPYQLKKRKKKKRKRLNL